MTSGFDFSDDFSSNHTAPNIFWACKMGLSTAAKVGIFCYVEWAIIHVAACGLIMINTLDNSSAKVGQMYVAVLGYFTAAGAGNVSVDEQVLGGELAREARHAAQEDVVAGHEIGSSGRHVLILPAPRTE